jgi:hypothetical protein
MADTVTSQNTELSSWDTLCIYLQYMNIETIEIAKLQRTHLEGMCYVIEYKLLLLFKLLCKLLAVYLIIEEMCRPGAL